MRKQYTAEQREKLIAEVRAGETVRVVAKRMGVTPFFGLPLDESGDASVERPGVREGGAGALVFATATSRRRGGGRKGGVRRGVVATSGCGPERRDVICQGLPIYVRRRPRRATERRAWRPNNRCSAGATGS